MKNMTTQGGARYTHFPDAFKTLIEWRGPLFTVADQAGQDELEMIFSSLQQVLLLKPGHSQAETCLGSIRRAAE
jgi:hypothetical protein